MFTSASMINGRVSNSVSWRFITFSVYNKLWQIGDETL